MAATSSGAPGMTRTPSVSAASRCSIFVTSSFTARWGIRSCTTSAVRRPWAISKILAGSRLFSSAQILHCRLTERVESTKTPSRSKRTAAQRKEFSLNYGTSCRRLQGDRRITKLRRASVSLRRWQYLIGAGNHRRAGCQPVANQEIFLAKMRVCSLSPGPHEIIVQAGSDQRADHRNDPSRPLLHHFTAGFHSDPLDDSRNKTSDYFLLHKFSRDVHPSRGGGGYP